jgi:hypothetical protein
MKQTAKLAIEAKAGLKIQELKKSPVAPIIKLSPNILHNYEGEFVTDIGLIAIKLSGNKLIMTSEGKSYQLIPRSDNTFTLGSRWLGQIPAFSNFLGEPRFTIDNIKVK